MKCIFVRITLLLFIVTVTAFAVCVIDEIRECKQAVNEAAVAVERLHKEIEALNAVFDAREKALDGAQKAFRPRGESIDPSFLIPIPNSQPEAEKQ